MHSKILILTSGLLTACLVLWACASSKPDLDPEFKPIQLHWKADSGEAENHPSKDMCVIQITAQLMQEKAVLQSKTEDLEYDVRYDLNGKNLVFEGIEGNKADESAPEYHWTATCGEGEKIVVKFHNGQ